MKMKNNILLAFLLTMPLFSFAQNVAGEVSDTLFDSRDSTVYQTITLNGKVWTQDNISFAAKGSDCFDHNPINCAKFGRLYTYQQAQTACPEGWHLPLAAEWDALIAASGGSKVAGGILKTGGISEFNIRMTGIRSKLDFVFPGQQTGFWGQGTGKPGMVYAVFFYRSEPKAKNGFVSEEEFRLSVRCIKN